MAKIKAVLIVLGFGVVALFTWGAVYFFREDVYLASFACVLVVLPTLIFLIAVIDTPSYMLGNSFINSWLSQRRPGTSLEGSRKLQKRRIRVRQIRRRKGDE